MYVCVRGEGHKLFGAMEKVCLSLSCRTGGACARMYPGGAQYSGTYVLCNVHITHAYSMFITLF